MARGTRRLVVIGTRMCGVVAGLSKRMKLMDDLATTVKASAVIKSLKLSEYGDASVRCVDG